MELLNVGCGSLLFDYATNIDIIEDKDLNIIQGFADELGYEPNSVDVIYMLCPYDYYPLDSSAYTVLKTDGLLVLTGHYQNEHFREAWLASETMLESLGFQTVSKNKYCRPEFRGSTNCNGKPISSDRLKQLVLKKIPDNNRETALKKLQERR
ncbi:hypothetical protein AEA09_14765 [Lysinibacillus contaminans]|uniref:Methyltransferase type 11 domain-containing protein n=1 Tax=Lysinibacillus contaminans TaxID=1293441 RepID=A0ABR5JYF0_9BACI|nr:hypothetical protein [Lysinibacillus contaminans]KOS67112.1 hypothetical protein AEA09_14765 [Lysinibacillus contaminans]